MRFLYIAIPALAALAQATDVTANDPPAAGYDQDLLEVAKRLGLSEFVTAFQKTTPAFQKLVSTKKTFFIPDNTGLKIDDNATPDQIEDILKWHVIDGVVTIGDGHGVPHLRNLAGKAILIEVGTPSAGVSIQSTDINVISDSNESARLRAELKDIKVTQGSLNVISAQLYVPGKVSKAAPGQKSASSPAEHPVNQATNENGKSDEDKGGN